MKTQEKITEYDNLEDYMKKHKTIDKKEQYVYVLKCNGYFKIGITNNIDNRISDIKVGNPSKIELIKIYDGLSNPQECEYAIHQELQEYRHQGEWFKCSLSQLNKAIKIALNKDKKGEVTFKKSNNQDKKEKIKNNIKEIEKIEENVLIIKASDIEIINTNKDTVCFYSSNQAIWKRMTNNHIKPFQDYYKRDKKTKQFILIGHGYIVSKSKIKIE